MTGGTGLIGTAVTKHLANAGHEVIILSRNPRQAGPMPESVSYRRWDAKTLEGDWAETLDGADAVINLAGAPISGEGFLPDRWSVERKHSILRSRVNSGEAIAAAIEQASNKPGVLIQSSAVGYYGTHANSVTITEESPAGNDFLADTSKQWEASTDNVEAMGVRRVIIRTGVVLDSKEGALPRLVFPFRLFAGGPLGSGKQPVPWIHIEDEARAIIFLTETEAASGPFNLTAPNPVTNAEFAQTMGKVFNRPAFVPAPGFAFKAAFGEVSTVILDGQRAIPQKLLDMGFEFKFDTLESALRDLYPTGL
jgi:hypothetical protein